MLFSLYISVSLEYYYSVVGGDLYSNWLFIFVDWLALDFEAAITRSVEYYFAEFSGFLVTLYGRTALSEKFSHITTVFPTSAIIW